MTAWWHDGWWPYGHDASCRIWLAMDQTSNLTNMEWCFWSILLITYSIHSTLQITSNLVGSRENGSRRVEWRIVSFMAPNCNVVSRTINQHSYQQFLSRLYLRMDWIIPLPWPLGTQQQYEEQSELYYTAIYWRCRRGCMYYWYDLKAVASLQCSRIDCSKDQKQKRNDPPESIGNTAKGAKSVKAMLTKLPNLLQAAHRSRHCVRPLPS